MTTRRPRPGPWAVALAALAVACTSESLPVGGGGGGGGDVQQSRVAAQDAEAGDGLGASVALTADRFVAGAPGDDQNGSDAGSAYVFLVQAGGAVQEAKLLAPDAAAGDGFGGAASADGDVASVAASLDVLAEDSAGSATIFRRQGTAWPAEAQLQDPTPEAGGRFGTAVSLDGDAVVFGAGLDDVDGTVDAGSALVFRFDGTTWSTEARLAGGDVAAGDRLGASVGLSGPVAVAGAPAHDAAATDAGAAYLFRRTGTTWGQETKLVASDAAAGDGFGVAVDVDGNVAVVGAPLQDGAATDAGAVYVFRFDGSQWAPEARLAAADPAADDRMGFSVAVSGDRIVAGAPGDDGAGDGAGAVHVFRFDGTSWTEAAELTAEQGVAGDSLGAAVDVEASTAVAGAPGDDGGGSGAGAVYLFQQLP